MLLESNMKLHPVHMVTMSQTFHAATDRLREELSDPGFWYADYSLLNLYRTFGFRSDANEKTAGISTDHFLPLGRISYNYDNRRQYLPMIGGCEVILKEPHRHVLLGLTKDGWQWCDEDVDSHTSMYVDNDRWMVEATIGTGEQVKRYGLMRLEAGDASPWGYVNIRDITDFIMRSQPTSVRAHYHGLEHGSGIRYLALWWERLHAYYRHHYNHFIDSQAETQLNFYPTCMIVDDNLMYRQALNLAMRILGVEQLNSEMARDPRLTYLTCFWTGVLLHTNLARKTLLDVAEEPRHLRYLYWSIKQYFIKRSIPYILTTGEPKLFNPLGYPLPAYQPVQAIEQCLERFTELVLDTMDVEEL